MTLDTPGNHLKVIFFFYIPFLAYLLTNTVIYIYIFYVFILAVPSVAPSGLRVSTLHFSELKVQWNQIPEHSVNGRLLGYVVIYEEYPYYRYNRKRVNTSSPDVHMLVLSGLKAAHSYRFCVAGFTRTGTGPLTPFYYVTTGKLNKSVNRA